MNTAPGSAQAGGVGPAPGVEIEDGVDVGSWQRLHPLSPIVRTGRAFVPVVFVLLTTFFSSANRGDALWHLGVVVVIAVAGVVSWLVTRWRVDGGALRVESGLLRRNSVRFPLAQVQAIDVVRPGLARALGLAELRLRSAGDTGGAGRLAYLSVAEAERVRAQLLALAHGVAGDSPAPPERPLFALDPKRLVASLALSGPFALLVVFGIATAVTAVFSPSAAGAVISASVAYLLAVVTILWRRFNGGWKLRVGEAADGLRLRFGLLETTAETIPRGRVQALRRTEPLSWRWAPWCRLQIDVAGRVGRREENQSQTRQLRDVLPVGGLDEATWLLDRLLPDRPEQLRPPPPRARVKSPLRYHWLGMGWNASAIAVTSGRLTRTTVWVPLAKVQNLRLVQGPVQRRLHLATLHIDTAGKRVAAAVRDRDAGEAEQLLAQLSAACRAAREPLHR